jgi:hypothetical protein
MVRIAGSSSITKMLAEDGAGWKPAVAVAAFAIMLL